VKGRAHLTNNDRWFLVQMYRWFPLILEVVTIVRPETLVHWHRAGFRRFWRWKSNSRGGRPRIEIELRALIRQISTENQLWGAPRIHGELLKLGLSVAQSTVAKYMVKRRGPPSQGWRTFLRTHAPDIAAMDLFVVPTIGFKLLYGFVIVRIDRRELIWINVTTNPTAEWIARQITEAFPWDGAPGYMIRDRDRIYGAVVTRRLRAMGIRDKPIAPASPWQNGFAERLIGSIRRECLDHIIVLGEVHLRRILKNYAAYYNGVRTHRSLNKDAPVSRPVQRSGVISSHAILGGLHHHYVRIGFSVHTGHQERYLRRWRDLIHNIDAVVPVAPWPRRVAVPGQPADVRDGWAIASFWSYGLFMCGSVGAGAWESLQMQAAPPKPNDAWWALS
jgi:transposase InsO family protein